MTTQETALIQVGNKILRLIRYNGVVCMSVSQLQAWLKLAPNMEDAEATLEALIGNRRLLVIERVYGRYGRVPLTVMNIAALPVVIATIAKRLEGEPGQKEAAEAMRDFLGDELANESLRVIKDDWQSLLIVGAGLGRVIEERTSAIAWRSSQV